MPTVDPTLAGQLTFTGRRLLLFGTGSLGAAFLPWWLNWVRMACPETEVQPVITRSAERFVSRQSLASLSNRDVPLDVWPDQPAPYSPHVHYATWPDAVVVYPASFHFLARFASGLADTPMTLALQCTSVPIGVAPAVPPGATGSCAYQAHIAALRQRPNVTVAEPIPGSSAHTRQFDAAVAAPLPVVLNGVEVLRQAAAGRDPEEG